MPEHTGTRRAMHLDPSRFFCFLPKLKESLLNQFLLPRNKTLDAAAIHDERNAPAARLLLSPKYSLAISSFMCWFGDTTGHWTECLCGAEQGSLWYIRS